MKSCMIGARGHSCYALNDLPELKNVELCAVSSGDEKPGSLLNKGKQWNPRSHADWRGSAGNHSTEYFK